MRAKNITVKYGKKVIINDFSHDFSDRVTAVMGESGSGKTTLLRALAGLTKISGGKLYNSEKISYMFQEPRLLPYLTALENVDIVIGDVEKSRAMLNVVGIADVKQYPSELSGGMQSRVALARALVYPSEMLLLDEPFSALDEKTADSMLDLIRNDGRRVIFVTHNQALAEKADKIIMIKRP